MSYDAERQFSKNLFRGVSVEDDLDELDEIIEESHDRFKVVRGPNKSEDYAEKRKRPAKTRQPNDKGLG